mmetsp:Transcript_42083/g.104650  ORF Transcript_42083/g.104650 Transcript_42083/m.104650 type:complete len:434 (-) Transcript_42083:8-1309(-)
MAAAPTAAIGDRIFARDRVNAWHFGDVIDERGEDENREVRVTFDFYNHRFDEWIGVFSGRLAQPNDAPDILAAAGAWVEDEYPADFIVARRKKGTRYIYKVRWQGCGPDVDTWEPARHIEPSLIDDFEKQQEAAAKAKQKTKRKAIQKKPKKNARARQPRQPRQPRAPRPPKQPFTVRVLGDDDEAADRRRLAPVTPWLRGLERQTAEHASHVIRSFKPRIVAKLPDAPPSVYADLHAALSERASPLALQGLELDEVVPTIKVKTGGQRIADTFSLNEYDLVAKFAGEAVKRSNHDYDLAVAPLEFSHHTTSEDEAKTEIRARAGFVRLEAGAFVDGNSPTPHWKFPHGVWLEEQAAAARDQQSQVADAAGEGAAGRREVARGRWAGSEARVICSVRVTVIVCVTRRIPVHSMFDHRGDGRHTVMLMLHHTFF